MPQVALPDLIQSVRSGDRLISFPTDTVPALAAQPDRADLIFAAKQRSLDKPLILMAATVDDLWTYVNGTSAERDVWEAVAHRYLPGALTLVLPASDWVPRSLNPKDPTSIGVRVPDHALARTILAQTQPLATTSVNRSGEPALQTLAEINQHFPDVLTPTDNEWAAHAPNSVIGSGVPSTIVRWTGAGWEILRQGAIVLEHLG